MRIASLDLVADTEGFLRLIDLPEEDHIARIFNGLALLLVFGQVVRLVLLVASGTNSSASI